MNLKQSLEKIRDELAAEFGEIEGWSKRVPYVMGFDAALDELLPVIEQMNFELIEKIANRGFTYDGEGFGKAIAMKEAGEVQGMMSKLFSALERLQRLEIQTKDEK